jgi:hypothetical protein
MTRGLLVGVILAGAALRIAALPLSGTPDVGSWKIWAYVGSSDPTGLYGVGGNPPERRLLDWHGVATTTDYPPLALYELAAIGRLYQWVDPGFIDSPLLTAFVKLPGLLAEVLYVVVLLAWGVPRFGAGARWAALAFWLNPAVLLNGTVLGYLDSQMVVPAALALLVAATGQPALAGMLAAIAVSTKAQAVFVLPAIGVAVWSVRRISLAEGEGRHLDPSDAPANRGRGIRAEWRPPLTALVACVTTAGLMVAPILIRGAVPNMIVAIRSLASHNMVSGYALNLWWILTWIVRSVESLDLGWWEAFTMEVRILQITDWVRTYPNPRPIGAIAASLAIGWGLWQTRRRLSPANAALLAGWCVYAYSMLAVQVHENHLYPAVPFLLLAAGLAPSLRPLAWTVSTMAALNMYLFYGLAEGWPPVLDRSLTGIDMSVIIAAVNVGVFLWTARTVARQFAPTEAERLTPMRRSLP